MTSDPFDAEQLVSAAQRKEALADFGPLAFERPLADAVLMVATLDEPPPRRLLGRDVLKALQDKIDALSASIDESEPITEDVDFPKGS